MASKKIFLMTLIFLPFVANANTPYIGVGVGYDVADFYKRLNIVTTNGTEIYDKEDNLAATGAFGSLIAGYQWNFNRFFVATELSGSLSSLKYHAYYNDKAENDASRGELAIDKSYGLDVLPGYLITDNVGLYAVLGYTRGHFKYAEYKDNTLGSDVGLTDYQWLNGIKYGIGATMPIHKQLNLRLQYNHIQYQVYTNKNFPMPAGQFRTIKFTPYSNQLELALVYSFA